MRKKPLVVLAAGLVFASCGGSSPSGSSPAGANPAPSPTPTLTPSPTPPAAATCPPIRWVPGESYGVIETPHFLPQVLAAQDRIFAAHPDLFALNPDGTRDSLHLKDNSVPTERIYYAYFVEQARVGGLCSDYAPGEDGLPAPNNSEEIWIGAAGQPLDAFRVTATTPPAPVIHKYIATNYLKGYGL